jgi:hypothetical protein
MIQEKRSPEYSKTEIHEEPPAGSGGRTFNDASPIPSGVASISID